MASGLHHKERQLILAWALKLFTAYSNCIAVASKITQQIIDADAVRQSNDPLLGFINIRMFNAGDQGMVMDSLGLSALGLYDIQCHFVGLEANQVAQRLFNIAYYIFDEEPYFENGHTIDGLNGENWRVQFMNSLVSPEREVLDLYPSDAYAPN